MKPIFPTFAWLDQNLRRNLSLEGKVLAATLPFSLLGIVYTETPLLLLFSATVSLLVLSFLWCRLFRPNVRLVVRFGEIVSVNQSFRMEVTVQNLRRMTARNLTVFPILSNSGFRIEGAENVFISELKPDHTAKVEFRGIGVKRDCVQEFGLGVSSNFPFSLVRTNQVVRIHQPVFVVPNFSESSIEAKGAIGNVNDFLMAKNQSEDSDEIIGSREYVTGMPVRKWDYGSWARTGKPYLREFQTLKRQSATILVDANPESGKDSMNDRFRLGIEHEFDTLMGVSLAVANQLTLGGIDIEQFRISDDQHVSCASLSFSRLCKFVAAADAGKPMNLTIQENATDVTFLIVQRSESLLRWQELINNGAVIPIPVSALSHSTLKNGVINA